MNDRYDYTESDCWKIYVHWKKKAGKVQVQEKKSLWYCKKFAISRLKIERNVEGKKKENEKKDFFSKKNDRIKGTRERTSMRHWRKMDALQVSETNKTIPRIRKKKGKNCEPFFIKKKSHWDRKRWCCYDRFEENVPFAKKKKKKKKIWFWFWFWFFFFFFFFPPIYVLALFFLSGCCWLYKLMVQGKCDCDHNRATYSSRYLRKRHQGKSVAAAQNCNISSAALV